MAPATPLTPAPANSISARLRLGRKVDAREARGHDALNLVHRARKACQMSSTLHAETAEASSKQAKRKEKKEKRDKSDKKEKKHKRDHDDPERSSKKRKRDHAVEEESQEPQSEPVTAVAPSDTPSDELLRKKRKKDKREAKKAKSTHDSALDIEPTTAAPPPSPNTEKLSSHTPFHQLTTSFYLPLSPAAYAFPLAGLCAEHLSPLLLTYHPPLRGVLLSYANVRLSEQKPSDANTLPESETTPPVLAHSINEYAPSFLWLTADFLVFRPSRGSWMEGYINLQNEGFIGVVCYNYFNAVVERENLPEGWRWVEDDGDGDLEDGGKEVARKGRKRKGGDGVGWFVDAQGKKVEGKIVFRVVDFEATEGNSSEGGVGTVSILGSLREEG